MFGAMTVVYSNQFPCLGSFRNQGHALSPQPTYAPPLSDVICAHEPSVDQSLAFPNRVRCRSMACSNSDKRPELTSRSYHALPHHHRSVQNHVHPPTAATRRAIRTLLTALSLRVLLCLPPSLACSFFVQPLRPLTTRALGSSPSASLTFLQTLLVSCHPSTEAMCLVMQDEASAAMARVGLPAPSYG